MVRTCSLLREMDSTAARFPIWRHWTMWRRRLERSLNFDTRREFSSLKTRREIKYSRSCRARTSFISRVTLMVRDAWRFSS